ncbi:MAG: hypothetical protein RXR43_04720 [Sulfolobus sp.]
MNTKLLAFALLISVLSNIYLAYLLAHTISITQQSSVSTTVNSQLKNHNVIQSSLSFNRTTSILVHYEGLVLVKLDVNTSNVTYLLVIISFIKHPGKHIKILILSLDNTTVEIHLEKGVYIVNEEFVVGYQGSLDENDINVQIIYLGSSDN